MDNPLKLNLILRTCSHPLQPTITPACSHCLAADVTPHREKRIINVGEHQKQPDQLPQLLPLLVADGSFVETCNRLKIDIGINDAASSAFINLWSVHNK